MLVFDCLKPLLSMLKGLLQPKTIMKTPEKILCPTDFEQDSSVCLAASCELAKLYSATLILLNVVSPLSSKTRAAREKEGDDVGAKKNKAKKYLIESLSRLVPETVEVKALLAEGEPAQKILQVAEKEKADMIILPSPSRDSQRKSGNGSTTQKLIEQADCSLYLVKV